jgi:hypothetical protein
VTRLGRALGEMRGAPTTDPMSPRSLACAGLGAIATLITPAAAAAPATPAAALTNCRLTTAQELHSGPSYLTSVAVSGTSCNEGVALAKAYYRCRVRAGGPAGRCRSTVLGFRCTETRTGIKIQYDGIVTCTRARVLHKYVQDT